MQVRETSIHKTSGFSSYFFHTLIKQRQNNLLREDRGHQLGDRKTQDFRVAMSAKSRMAQLFKDFREISIDTPHA